MRPGVWLVIAAVAAGAATALVLRTRLPAGAVLLLLAASGATVGWGGMLLQPDPSAAEAGVAVAALAILVPFHVRVVLGPFGRRGRDLAR